MQDFEYGNYLSEEIVVPDEKLGKYNLPFIIFPFCFLFIYIINFGTTSFILGIDDFFTLQNLFLVFSVGFLSHEILHFIPWKALTNFSVQEFRIGMRWHSFTPVIGCQRPMKLNAFRFGLFFPFLVLGVGPMFFAFYWQNTWLLFCGNIFMAWASGDIVTLLLLWKVHKNAFVEMHRAKMGAIVFNPREPMDALVS